jgi:hypothetical protein
MAMGAASARMPVTSAKRFIGQFPFKARRWAAFGFGKRAALSPDARAEGNNLPETALNRLMHK